MNNAINPMISGNNTTAANGPSSPPDEPVSSKDQTLDTEIYAANFTTTRDETSSENNALLNISNGNINPKATRANVEGQLTSSESRNGNGSISSNDTAIALAGPKSHPLFVKGKGDKYAVDINDIRQGQYGDCFFLGAIGAVAQNSPKNIENMIKPTTKYGEEGYMVTFKGGTRTFVSKAEVEAQIKAGNGAATGDGGETWVKVLEIALQKIIRVSPSFEQPDVNFSKGGFASEVLPLLTGRTAANVAPSKFNGAHMQEQLRSGAVMTAASDGNVQSTKLAEKYGVAINKDAKGNPISNMVHEYAIKNVSQGADGKYYVTLFNPWGAGKSPRPIPMEDFKQIFGRITVS
jgi:Calpain family cysteine protease